MSDHLNRRHFLSTSVATATAASLAPVGLAQDDKTPSANDEIRVGVMGLSRGRALARSFSQQEGVRLKYACDIDDYRASACADDIEKAAGYRPQTISDFRQILDDPDIDVLVCAAPNHWHAPATIMACNAGKHVYVEKPCSHNPWEGEMMVKAARTHNRCVQMGSQRRSSDGFITAVQKLHEGVIGRVFQSQSWYNSLRPSMGKGVAAEVPAHFDYDLWQGPAPRVPYKEYIMGDARNHHYNWHWLWHWGNGELGNNGVHALDICRWGLGVDYPVRVTSSGGRYRYDDDQETPDTHVVAFEFDDKQQITWTGLSCNKHKVNSGFVAFFGEEGSMEIDGNGNTKIYDRADKLIEEFSGSYNHDDHIANLLTCIRNDDPMSLFAEIETGHKSTLLCHLGNIAHRTGRTLTCRPEDGHIIGDEKAMAYWKREYEPGWEPTV